MSLSKTEFIKEAEKLFKVMDCGVTKLEYIEVEETGQEIVNVYFDESSMVANVNCDSHAAMVYDIIK